LPGLARFRVNAFNQERGAAAVFRTIPSEILSLEDLDAPKFFTELTEKSRGLVLVTGPTGFFGWYVEIRSDLQWLAHAHIG
jgi:twitching motility protein PilT